MRGRPRFSPIDLALTPLEAVARWPVDRPLALLHSGGRASGWSRWSILASPSAWFVCDRRPRLIGRTNDDLFPARLPEDPLAALAAVRAATGISPAAAGDRAPGGPPFRGGWIGSLAYDLGRAIEPAADRGGPDDDREWPDLVLGWCPDAIVHDRTTGRWTAVGDGARLAAALAPAPSRETFRAGDPWTSSLTPDAYLARVERTLAFIAAGDVYQVNLTQRLTASAAGSTRALARRALAASGAWYGAALEFPDGRAIVSMSPELFLRLDRDGTVVTRPIKGTRPSTVARRELLESEKDAAELHMIVDLMRNDLGRVCRPGSIRVPRARRIETHPTVHHGVGEVRGTLADGADVTDLLRASFPPGSITGAPKIRAMQIIDDLEPVRRGPYCGAIGWLGDDGAACLNVAIRTIALTGTRPAGRWDSLEGTADYGVGGGIVADSTPLDEYRECLAKAAVLRASLRSANVETSKRRNVETGR